MSAEVDSQARPNPAVLNDLPVCEICDRLSWEIELAAARCLLIDKVVGEVVENLSFAARAKVLAALQDVDVLHQELQGLAAFSRTLTRGASRRARVSAAEAINAVSLGVLAERLGASMGAYVDAEGAAPGDLDLF